MPNDKRPVAPVIRGAATEAPMTGPKPKRRPTAKWHPTRPTLSAIKRAADWLKP